MLQIQEAGERSWTERQEVGRAETEPPHPLILYPKCKTSPRRRTGRKVEFLGQVGVESIGGKCPSREGWEN